MIAAHCIVCGKEAPLCCSACKTLHYCSKDHQVAHWKLHKVNCSGKNYKVEWDINTGHHLVALKDLEAGIITIIQIFRGEFHYELFSFLQEPSYCKSSL